MVDFLGFLFLYDLALDAFVAEQNFHFGEAGMPWQGQGIECFGRAGVWIVEGLENLCLGKPIVDGHLDLMIPDFEILQG
ncbi:MAG: hypothetical protein BWY82_01953 [Verrucomicrobia bacterium ADurb.Bin474]|nr:MAG: hypothetical protein BWY82_01953 [Verrucomicrobia bacterium ADurb.Bin474]